MLNPPDEGRDTIFVFIFALGLDKCSNVLMCWLTSVGMRIFVDELYIMVTFTPGLSLKINPAMFI